MLYTSSSVTQLAIILKLYWNECISLKLLFSLNTYKLSAYSVWNKVLKYFYNSDVTLACEDVSFYTHKVILSNFCFILVDQLKFFIEEFLQQSLSDD